MAWKNTPERYGWLTISLHWITALIIIGLAILGLWMTGLSYYSPYYHRAPSLHKSIGLSLALLLILRWLWHRYSSPPRPVAEHSALERRLARLAQTGLYLLLALILISGYLISTATGQGVSFFGWFEIPALVSHLPDQADRAGLVHYWLALTLLTLAGLHALAALKHHFIDRDPTLRRMLFPSGAKPRRERRQDRRP